MEKYEELKKVIQEANPEIMGDWSGCDVCGTMCGICDDRFLKEKSSRPIRLADVLLAVEKTYSVNSSYQPHQYSIMRLFIPQF